MMRISILSVALVVGLTAQSFAQDVRIHISKDSVLVGEQFFVTVAVDARVGEKILFPAMLEGSISVGDAEFIRPTEIVEATDITTSRTDSATYVVAVFGIDSAFVGGLPYAVITAQSDTLILSSPTALIGIRSIVPEEAQGIRDLAPLATFPVVWWPWVLASILLVGAIILAIRWWRIRQNKPVTFARKPAAVDPYDEAVARLSRLADTAPESEDEVKAYYVELSDILRNYLEYTIQIPALERTTRELLAALERVSGIAADLVPESVIDQIGRTLDVSDLAKFASHRPAVLENTEFVELARDAIETMERSRRQRAIREAEEASAS